MKTLEYRSVKRYKMKSGFFTKKSLIALFEEAGFKIQLISGYALVKDKYFFLRTLATLWPELFALQFLIEAIKK